MGNTATVLNIQRMSTEDGPGIRTTVFFKGCPLACSWCHNPESISPRPELVWLAEACIGCEACIEACRRAALSLDGQGVHIDRRSCVACGDCVDDCAGAALERLGTTWRLDALCHELLKDRAYYARSDGGVTLSGGEAAMQAGFAAALMARLRAEGVHVALDTCGLTTKDRLLELVRRADLVLYDIKEMDSGRHEAATGQPNERILENVMALAQAIRDGGLDTTLWIRTPLIPGATATPAQVAAIGRFIADALGAAVSRWELCAFNNLCREQYSRLGKTWAFADTERLSEAELADLVTAARASGVDPEIVVGTGPTRSPGGRS